MNSPTRHQALEIFEVVEAIGSQILCGASGELEPAPGFQEVPLPVVCFREIIGHVGKHIIGIQSGAKWRGTGAGKGLRQGLNHRRFETIEVAGHRLEAVTRPNKREQMLNDHEVLGLRCTPVPKALAEYLPIKKASHPTLMVLFDGGPQVT